MRYICVSDHSFISFISLDSSLSLIILNFVFAYILIPLSTRAWLFRSDFINVPAAELYPGSMRYSCTEGVSCESTTSNEFKIPVRRTFSSYNFPWAAFDEP